MKHSEIIDVILYYNELELLKRRISYLDDSVKKFIVINFNSKTIDFEHPKLSVINYKRKLEFFNKNFLSRLLRRSELNFIRPQDYLLISKTFEIPDKSTFPEIKKSQDYKIKYLIHKNIFWTPNLVSDYMYVGTRLVSVTSILQNPKLHEKYLYDNLISTIIHSSIKSGWSLQGFQSNEDFFQHVFFWGPESLRDKLSKVEDVEYYKENMLSFDYPTKISQLKIQLESDVPEEFLDLRLNFEVRDPKDFYLCLEDFEFEIPNKVLYGDYEYEKFCDVFKKNEVLKILKTENLLLTDRVHIKEKTKSEYLVFTYLDILNSVPSNII